MHFTRANPVYPAFPIVVFPEGWPHESHDLLVVRRRESQELARAGHRFRDSSEVTGVLAGKRFCCSFPGQLDVIHSERAAPTEIRGVGAGKADRHRFAIAGKATGTARR